MFELEFVQSVAKTMRKCRETLLIFYSRVIHSLT